MCTGDCCLGTGKVRRKGCPVDPWSQCHDDVKRPRFSHSTAQPPWLCNGNKRNTARADGPTHAGLAAGRADVCEPHATEVPHEPFNGWGTTEAGADLRLRRTRAARVVPGRIWALEIVPLNNLLPLFANARSRRGRATRRSPRVTSLVHTAIRRRGAAHGTQAAGPGALWPLAAFDRERQETPTRARDGNPSLNAASNRRPLQASPGQRRRTARLRP